jgi:sporulation protein YlmC with PRC-barrel domain
MKLMISLFTVLFALSGVASAQTQRGQEQSAQINQQQMIPADSLLDSEVVSQEGQEIGKIENVYIEKSRGQVAYAIVSQSRAFGVGKKFFVIPWESLQSEPGDKKLQINVSKEVITSAPTVSSATAKELSDATWLETNFKYYDAQPFWKAEASSSSAAGSVSSPASRSSGGASSAIGSGSASGGANVSGSSESASPTSAGGAGAAGAGASGSPSSASPAVSGSSDASGSSSSASPSSSGSSGASGMSATSSGASDASGAGGASSGSGSSLDASGSQSGASGTSDANQQQQQQGGSF